MVQNIDRYIPFSVNQTTISKNKHLKIDPNIDLFNNDIKMLKESSCVSFNDKIKALDTETLIEQLVEKNKNKIDNNQQFMHMNLKNHGQKNWINLKKNFIGNAFLTDALSVLKVEKVFKYNDMPKPKTKKLKFSDILITNYKKNNSKIPNIEPFRILEAPNLKNDFYSNPLTWSSTDILAVGLDKSVYLWDPHNFQTKTLLESEYLTGDDDTITSLCFCPSKRCDFLACGTKSGKLLLLKTSSINNENPFNKVVLHTINGNENILFENKIGNKGICSIKWYLNPLKHIDKVEDKEEWILFCGNETGEVFIFQLIEESLQRKTSNYKNEVVKSQCNAISSINIIENNFNLKNELDDLVEDFDTTDLSIDTSDISEIEYSQSNDYTYQNIFLTPFPQAKQKAVSNFRQNVTNVVNSSKIQNKRTIKSHSNVYVTTTKYYSLKNITNIKPQTQQLCGMDITTIYDKNGKFLKSQLAVGGNDNSCTVWDISTITNPEFMYNLVHFAAVKGVLYCPWLDYILATGGGSKDRFIRVWNTKTGTLIKKIKTAGQITSLIWSRHKHELILTFGFGNPEQPVLLKIFEYPTMQLKRQIKTSDHTRVLCSAISPNYDVLVLATNDETLKFFNLLENSQEPIIKKAEFLNAYNNHQMNNKLGINLLPKSFYI